MTFDRQGQLFGCHALAVIGDRQQCPPTIAQIDVHPRSASIQRIFHQFLERGRRPFDHLTGGNLIDQVLGQDAQGHVGDARNLDVLILVGLNLSKHKARRNLFRRALII